MSQYRGLIKEIIFRNEENGYTILTVKPEHGESFTAVGIIPFAAEGDYVEMTGEWTQHGTYGQQFRVSVFQFCQPEGTDALEK